MKERLSELSSKVISLRLAFQAVELHPWTAREIAEELTVQVGHLIVAYLISRDKDAPVEVNRGIASLEDELADVGFHLVALGIYSGVGADELESFSPVSVPDNTTHGLLQLSALAGQILESVMSTLSIKFPLDRPGHGTEELFMRDRIKTAIALLSWISTDLGVGLDAALDRMFEDARHFLRKRAQVPQDVAFKVKSGLAQRLQSRLVP